MSVTLAYYIETAKDIIRHFPRLGRTVILVFSPSGVTEFQGERFYGGDKYTG